MSSSLHDRPNATELLEAIATTLDQRVLPEVDGGVRHDVRVAANLCRIIARELASADALASVQAEFQSLVGHDSLTGVELLDAVSQLIDDGQLDDDSEAAARSAALAHVQAKLAVSQPGYDTAS